MEYFVGMSYLFRGFGYLGTKGLKRFIILPMIFNILIFIGVFFSLYHFLFPYTYQFIEMLPSWLSFLTTVLLIIFTISFFFLALSMFTVLFNLIAAPFNGLLAEKAQNLLYNTPIPPISFSTIALRTIKRQWHFLAFFIPRFIGICILFFIPFIQPIYPLLWFFFNAWMLSVQYQDYVYDNNLIDFREMQENLGDNKMLTLGFGSLINILSFVPFVNLLTMPAAVIGSVILFSENNPNINKIGSTKLIKN